MIIDMRRARIVLVVFGCTQQVAVLAIWACKKTDENTEALTKQSVPPMRLAMCITGLLVSGRREDTDKRRGTAIYDARTYEPLRNLTDALADRGITNDIFLRLDMRSELLPRRQGAGGWYNNFTSPDNSFDVAAALALPECNTSGSLRSIEVLQPAIRALRPISVKTEPLECYCGKRAHACACEAVAPNWWEQQIKSHACFKDVLRHERQNDGLRYDFVLRLRSDFSVVRNGLTAASIAAMMHRNLYGTPRISAFPWGTTSAGKCYINSDWAYFTPRKLAAIAFGIPDASCEWHKCMIRQRELARRPICGGDVMSIDWWQSHGVPFDAMLTETPPSQRGLLNNLACSWDAPRLGLISKLDVPGLSKCRGLCSATADHVTCESAAKAQRGA